MIQPASDSHVGRVRCTFGEAQATIFQYCLNCCIRRQRNSPIDCIPVWDIAAQHKKTETYHSVVPEGSYQSTKLTNPLPIAVATTKNNTNADHGTGYRIDAIGMPGDIGTLA